MNSKFQSTLAVAFVAVSLNAQSVSTILSGLYEPHGVAIDSANNYYVADGGNGNQIVKLTPDGTVSVFAGIVGVAGSDNGDVGTEATFNEPWGIVYVPRRGGLVVSDSQNQVLRFVNISSSEVTNLAGIVDPYNGGGTNDGPLGVAQFSYPAGLAADTNGNVYIADMGNGSIRKLGTNNLVSTIITNLSRPTAVAWNKDDNSLWVANSGSNQVVHYTNSADSTNWTSREIVGDPVGDNVVDSSIPTKARFNGPRGLVWIGGQTGLVVSDTGNNALRKITTNSSGLFAVVSTLTNGLNGLFNTPLGLTVDADNSILIADSKSASIKAFIPPSQPVPTISLPSGAYSNAVSLQFASTSTDPDLYFLYKTNPSPQSDWIKVSKSTTPSITIDGNATTKGAPTVLLMRSFSPNLAAGIVVSNSYKFFVAPLLVTAGTTNTTNITVYITNATEGAVIHVKSRNLNSTDVLPLLDYTDTLPGSTTISTTIYFNQELIVTADRVGFASAAPVANTYHIKLSPPIMSPSSGYFPAGARVTFTNNPLPSGIQVHIHYTLDGLTPTADVGTDYHYTNSIDLNTINNLDLNSVKAVAYADDMDTSDVVSGQPVPNNSIGLASSVIGGAGSIIVLPIVVNLQSNNTLKSLQFKMEVSPLNNAVSNTDYPLELVPLSASDYVPVTGISSGVYMTNFITSTYVSGSTNGLTLYVNSDSAFKDFGVIANVKVRIPRGASNNSTYLVNITNISGTSDGSQASVPLTSASGTITVSSYFYLAGDSSPGKWYNAGDFGSGFLDNADVNASFTASLEIHKPYPGTDAFNVMDVYPESGGDANGVGGIIGDGLITYMDWQHILMRSLGRETNSWQRWWTNGTLHHKRIDGTNNVPSLPAPSPASLDIWLRYALIWGETLYVERGKEYRMPIYAKVLPGFELNGLQLRVVMEAQDTAPAPGSVEFVVDGPLGDGPLGTPPYYFAASNDVAFAWPLGSLAHPLVNSNLIGYVKFTVPANALTNQHYTISLKYPQGAKDSDTELQLESAAGQVWVRSEPPKSVLHIVSDQWKINFFGSLSNTNADPEADPDGDHVPNWMEYLAGTNPTNAESHLSFSHADMSVDGHRINLHWPAMTGRVYVFESSPTLVNGTWKEIPTNILGDGTLQSFTATNAFDKSQFYRIRLVEP